MRNQLIGIILIWAVPILLMAQGQNNIQLEKVKQPKIGYKWHEGKALLKSGLIIYGKFKYKESKNDIPQFLYKERGVFGKRKIDVSLFSELTLAGTERGITARRDSTEWVWLDGYNDLMRVVRRGEISVFDNSKIVNEKYKFLVDYYLVATRHGYGYKTINKLKDIKLMMDDRPYFMESAKATGKKETRDMRVAIYLIDLFNDPAPIEKLGWEEATLTRKNGTKLEGFAYIQPIDLRNEFNTDKYSYIHFYNGKKFELIRSDELKSYMVGGKEYVRGHFSLTDKYFLGLSWRNDGADYLIAKKIVNRNSYFFRSRYNNGEDLVVLQNIAGSYKRPLNEALLRMKYVEGEKRKSQSQAN